MGAGLQQGNVKPRKSGHSGSKKRTSNYVGQALLEQKWVLNSCFIFSLVITFVFPSPFGNLSSLSPVVYESGLQDSATRAAQVVPFPTESHFDLKSVKFKQFDRQA